MADALVSPVLEQLTTIVAQQVQEELNLVVGVKKQINKLKSNLLAIQSVLEDADRKQVKDAAVRDWVDKLKDVCYDMDDVLDEWSTAILTWKMGDAEENTTHSLQKMRCSFLRSPCLRFNQVVRRRDIALKIKEVSEKVDEIAKEKAMYGFELYRATDELKQLTSTSFVDESSVSGRDYEIKTVVSKLLGESSQKTQGVEVISIVGMGGIGKTTLAQLAFNDAEVMAHFEEKIWVCVSEPFDEVRIAKAILEALEGRAPNLVELQSLLQRVSESIKGKRFLLVLDDVWTENDRQWEPLKRSLKGGALRSRILVTCCSSLKELPQSIGKLTKLRHLKVYGSDVAFIPKGIERMTGLRTLDWFIVCGGGENESKAANLRELKNLNHIGGSLMLSNLRDIEDVSEAVEAQLKNKKRLLRLELHFDGEKTELQANESSLIEALQPPSDLENLTIEGYGGNVWPNWMVTLTRLQELALRGCGNVEVLPPLGRLPNLQRLDLVGLKIRRLGVGFLGIENVDINEGEIARVAAFPKLKELHVWYLEELGEWDGIERRVGEEDANTASITFIMPQLRYLKIHGCPLLRALPDYVLSSSLQTLYIGDCPNLGKRYNKEEMGEDWHQISHIPDVQFF